MSELAVPLFMLGNSQTYDVAGIQSAAYVGVYGVSLWLAFLNAGLYLIYRNVALKRWRFRSVRMLGAVLAILALYALPRLLGEIRLSRHAGSGMAAGAPVRIGLVQPNIDPYEKWKGHADAQIAVLESLTVESAKRHADIVIWPETALPLYILLPENSATFGSIRRRVDSLGVSLLTGYTDWRTYPAGLTVPKSSKTDAERRRFDIFNSVMFLQPHVDSIQIYDKVHLLPFAERVPYADLISFLDLNFIRWNFGTGGYGVGRSATVFEAVRAGLPHVKFSTVICFESVFPGFVREFVRKGAEFLVVVTNDTWWGKTAAPVMHSQIAALRAVENHRWVVRCGNDGVSSVFDPYGRRITATELFTRTTLEADIRTNTEATFYSEHGDWLALGCVIVAGGASVLSLLKRGIGRMEKGAHDEGH